MSNGLPQRPAHRNNRRCRIRCIAAAVVLCLAGSVPVSSAAQPLPALQIKSVTFSGNRAIGAEALRPLVQSTVLDSVSLSGDAARLSASYKQAGYLLFRIDSLQTRVLPDSAGVALTVHLTEGSLWLVAQVRF
ncbi:MAG: hypothetical protein IAF08_05825, partial [Rhizobacter sp.]|nr:hypothetical protein [Chlorobiales bacterium]